MLFGDVAASAWHLLQPAEVLHALDLHYGSASGTQVMFRIKPNDYPRKGCQGLETMGFVLAVSRDTLLCVREFVASVEFQENLIEIDAFWGRGRKHVAPIATSFVIGRGRTEIYTKDTQQDRTVAGILVLELSSINRLRTGSLGGCPWLLGLWQGSLVTFLLLAQLEQGRPMARHAGRGTPTVRYNASRIFAAEGLTLCHRPASLSTHTTRVLHS